MPVLSRRSFVARSAAVAGAGGLPFSIWAEQQAKADNPRTRFEATTSQGQAMIEKYARAVAKMMDAAQNPEKSPTSWLFQWYTHAVAGNKTLSGEIARVFAGAAPTDPNRLLAAAMWSTCQAHGVNGLPQDERMFLPWHRMYVYFFERVIRKILADDTFTLPYWDYTTQGKRAIPEQFRLPADPIYKVLYRADRNDGTNGTAKVNAGEPIDRNRPSSPLNLQVLSVRHYDPQGVAMGFNDSLDLSPHGDVHVLVGNRVNMGAVPWAARDPIFWLHHCNIDRLWASWNKGGRVNPGGNWLTQSFVFADENGNRIDATVRDFVETEAIKAAAYRYDKLEPVPPLAGDAARPSVATVTPAPSIIASQAQPGSVKLAEEAPVSVPLAATAELMAAAIPTPDNGRVFLVLQNLQANTQPGVLYDVYLDPPSGGAPNPQSIPVGTLNFFNLSDREGTNTSARLLSFDVTEPFRSLIAGGGLGMPTVRIAPAGEAAADANTVIGAIRLVRQ
jgi:tyrosinase